MAPEPPPPEIDGLPELGERVSLAGASAYAIEREIGRGGMGVVFEARQEGLGRPVALKALYRDVAGGPAAEHFAEEARIAGRLEHPGIVPVHAYGISESGAPFLALKLVRGVPWSRLLHPGPDEEERKRAAALDQRAHLRTLVKLCEAVAFVHDRGVVHRDLKPDNVMIGEFGEVVLMDFGVALDLSLGPPPAPAEGAPRPLAGTPSYMAPEMAMGEDARLGPATDVYLLGGILYEILTGGPPHRGKTAAEALDAVLGAAVPAPETRAGGRPVPPELSDLCRRALDEEPARRPAGAAAFAREIEEFLEEEAARSIAAEAARRLAGAEEAALRGDLPTERIYAELRESIAGFEQAQRIAPRNRAAGTGATRARLALAAIAADEGDLSFADATLAKLEGGAPGLAALRERIVVAREERVRSLRRRKALVSILLLATAAAGILWLAFFSGTRRATEAERAQARRAEALALTEGTTWREPRDVIPIFERALAIDPDWHEGYVELAAARLRYALALGELDDPRTAALEIEAARQALARGLARFPLSDSLLYYTGYCHQMLGEDGDALAFHRRAAAAAPGSHDGLAAATVLALAERRFKDAERVATEAMANRGDEDEYARRAIARFCLGDLEGAAADVARAEEILPGQADYDALAALILLARGDERGAAERLVDAARLHPRSPHLKPLLAYLAARRGDREQAAALEAAARAAFRDYARCNLDVDLVYSALAEAPPPRRALGRAFVIDEDLAPHFPSRPSAGVLAREEGEKALADGRPAEALAAAERAIAADPADGLARLLAARALRALGHRDAARAEAQVAAGLAPNRAREAEEAGR